MKKVIYIIAIVIAIIIAGILFTILSPKGYLSNDGEGNVQFEHLKSDSGFGTNIKSGKFPMDINLTKGKINIKITKGDSVIFEQKKIK